MVYEGVRDKVDFVFKDLGEQDVKNITRPVRVWQWMPSIDTMTSPIDVSQPVPGFDGRPAIAVLAFDNLSRDPDQEFLADGIAEDILTKLAMWRWLPVISRNSSFTYKGKATDVKQIGLELGARYVLEGSVRKAGNRVRVTGQLIDAENDHHVWADRYDRDLDDIFAVQDEITEAIVAALEPAVGRAEMQRAQRKDPQNLDAWDYHQRGMWHMSKVTQRDLEQANKLLREAMRADTNFAPPYAGLAFLGFLARSLSYVLEPAVTTADAQAAAARAVRLDEMDPFAHAALGITRTLAREHDAAVASANRSVTLNPSYAFGYQALHMTTSMMGDYPASLKASRQACRISPNDPWLFYFLTGVSGCHYMMGEYEQAIESGLTAVERYPQYANSHRWLAMSLAQVGRMDEAMSEIQKYLSLTPNAYEAARDAYPYRNQADLEHYRDGLRKAGIKV
jgi:adenylate cyclase